MKRRDFARLAQRTAEISARGVSVRSAWASVLGGTELYAHNTFENADAVAPLGARPELRAGKATFVLPAGSVCVAGIQLV
jgi:hypothetical protein